MKKKNIVYGFVAIVAIVIILYSLGIFSGSEAYTNIILEERQEKETFMKRGSDSPLTDEDKRNFKGLNYFPPDPAYKVNARLTIFQNKTVVKIPTSDNKEQSYIKYAFAEFEIKDTTQRVLLLKAIDGEDPNELFLAFSDNTSGNETYGGGRYLDLTHTNDRRIIIDFNKAYNPFCVFNNSYSCPFPPKENHLSVAIEAGEKNYDY